MITTPLYPFHITFERIYLENDVVVCDADIVHDTTIRRFKITLL